MTTPLDHDVLHSLKLQGYTVLVAENQTKLDWYIFTPKKWDLDAFIGDAVMHGFDNQEIITINEALKLNLEDLMNHQVIIGGEMQ